MTCREVPELVWQVLMPILFQDHQPKSRHMVDRGRFPPDQEIEGTKELRLAVCATIKESSLGGGSNNAMCAAA